MNTPTPEQFLTQPYDPDEDLEPIARPGDVESSVPIYGFTESGSIRGGSIIVSPESIAVGHLTPRPDPLSSIAASLEALSRAVVDIAVEGVFGPIAAGGTSELEQRYDRLDQEYADLEDKHLVLYELLAEVEKIVAKSSSKVSLEVKAAINAWRSPVVDGASEPVQGVWCAACEQVVMPDHVCPPPGPAPTAEHVDPPANDAPVDAWRAYARSKGVDVSDRDNRSQIRTALGLPHFDAAQAEA